MPRKIISLMVICYALAFAFGALTAVRWPSIMLALGWLAEGDIAANMEGVNWRELGISHGAPYLLAALCFYASAIMISARREGGVLWYAAGCTAGFPVMYLVSFEHGWWHDPSAAEGAVAGAAVAALLIGAAIWDLRRQGKPERPAIKDAEAAPAEPEPAPVIATPAPVVALVSEAPKKKPARPRPAMVPAAIARQRASYAAYGRKMNARRH